MFFMQLFNYKDFDCYLALDSQDKLLFDFLYPILIRQGYISDSNQQLLDSFNGCFTFKSERALRDHLGILIKAGLIERKLDKQFKNNHPILIRYLYLNKYRFPEVAALKRPSNKFRAGDR